MFSTSEKTTKTIGSAFRQGGDSTFFRKSEDAAFFGSKDTKDNSTFFAVAPVQAKLSVSTPDDPHEKEADHVAEHVMRAADTPAPAVQKEDNELHRKEEEEQKDIHPKLETPAITSIQCKEEEHGVQAKLMHSVQRMADDDSIALSADASSADSSSGHLSLKAIPLCRSPMIQRSGRAPPAPAAHFESALSSSKGGGSALPGSTRQYMESRFGADFGGVRIHTGTQAESLSSSINAQAFTHGNDIYFNAGKYSPDSQAGGLLLAHELTHTIQQGASRQPSPGSASISRKPMIQRTASSRPVPSQLNNAVAKAKGEVGKVHAHDSGPDGYRMGWERLVEYFKTTLGADKVVPDGGAYVKGAVAEKDIKKARKVDGMPPANPRPADGPYKRDAMPSWCGIFAFWSLHKGGVPMKKWEIGGKPAVDPAAAYPKGYVPKAGDIAYRDAFSHYALVEKASGDTVTTVNGNTAGEDNLGGEVQVKDHPMSNWTAFFDPLMMKDGPLGSGDAPEADSKPKTLKELRKELFKVDRKMQDGPEPERDITSEEHTIQTKPELSTWHVSEGGRLSNTNGSPPVQAKEEQLQPKEEEYKKEEEKAAAHPVQDLQRKSDMSATHDEDHQPEDAHATGGMTPSTGTDLSTDNASGHTAVQRQEEAGESDRGPPVQFTASNNTIQCSWLDSALSVVNSAVDLVSQGLEAGKRILLGEARDFAMAIPGYKALRVVLGEDPITNEAIERNGHNFIEAAFDIMPGGRLLHQKLEELGALTEAEQWVDRQIAAVTSIVHGISNRIETFWNSLTLSDLSSPQHVFERIGSIIHDTISSIVDFAVRAATELLSIVKRYLLTQLVNFIKNHTSAYPLLCVILGQDPVTEQAVARNGTNILNALLELGGEEGRQQRTQMQSTGTFQKVANWIDRGIAVFSSAYRQIRAGISAIWDIVSIDSLMHPIDTFNRIYDTFAPPIRQIWDFVRDTAAIILRFIKEVLLRRLSEWARTVRGYQLLTVIIEKDPFTDEVVPRTMENIIRGFMSLMDGGLEQFEQLKQSGAIERTTQKINAAVRRLNMTPASIVALFINLWNSMSLNDLIHPIDAFRRIVAQFGEPIGRLIAFVIEIIKIVIEVILVVMNFPTDLISNIITKAMQAYELIKRDPVGFLKNLLRAIKEGFMQFFSNIITHLLNGLKVWFLSEVEAAGIPIPTDFTVMGIIKWLLIVLDITMEKIWKKLEDRIGKEKVDKIKRIVAMAERVAGVAGEAYAFYQDVQQRGFLAVMIDKVKEQLSNVWEMVMGAVKNFVMDQIINKVTAKILSMLDPTGIMAVINSAIALYKAVQSFIRYLRQMLEIVNSFVEGTLQIAQGSTKKAADFLEGALARGVPIVIGFLANQIGLNLSSRLRDALEGVREWVDKGLTWVIDKVVGLVERLVAFGRNAVESVLNWLGFRQRFSTEKGENHTIYIRDSGETPALIIESTPVDVLTYFNQKETEINGSTTLSTSDKSEKIGKITHGKNLLQGLQALMNNAKSAKRNDPRIPQMITDIIGIVKEIDPGTSQEMVPTPVFTPGFNNTKASSFSARYVYKGGTTSTGTTIPQNHANGTEPTDSNLVDAWRILSGLQLSSRWVRFHILNRELGGIAADSNLIPTPTLINNEYKDKLETDVKGYYDSGRPIWLSANVTYRSIYNSLFPQRYTAEAGAMKYQNNQWVEDPEKRKTFSSGIDPPETAGFNINTVISNPDVEYFVVNMSSMTKEMVRVLRTNRPASGYTFYRQMERVLLADIFGRDVISFDPEVINALTPKPTKAQNDAVSRYKRGLSSINWTF